MLHIALNILAFLFAVFVLVTVHEFGHFIVARWCGVKVIRFSIGFGKLLYRWHDRKNTEYVIAVIPLGGYVKLLDERETQVNSADQPFAFNNKPLHQRAAILAAGPLMNVLLAIAAYCLVFSIGVIQVKPIIETVVPNSIAAQAGLKAGEEIVAIGDEVTRNWFAVAMRLVMRYGETGTLKITVQNHQARTVNLNLKTWHLDKLRPDIITSIGVKPFSKKVAPSPEQLIKIKYLPWQAFVYAIFETFLLAKFNLIIIYKLITGVLSWHGLGGPLTIFQGAAFAAQQGLVAYISFLAFFSISIAVLNLLPIPGLDGSQLVYALAEFIMRRPVPISFQILTFRLGIIALSIFFLQVVLNDLQRLL